MKVAARGDSGSIDGPRLQELCEEIASELGRGPDLLVVYYTEAVTPSVKSGLGSLLGVDAVIGASSCQGVATHEGIHGPGDQGVALLGIADDDGSFGTGFASFDVDVADAVTAAFNDALTHADRPGELPTLVVVHSSPGHEEEVIAAVNELTGGHSPIVGGSAADDTINGGWSCFANDDGGQAGVALALLFPSTPVNYAFQSGYSPAGPSGTVTRADDRVMHEIDGEPAADVYNRWTEGAIDEAATARDGSILGETTLFPLGREVGRVEVGGTSVPEYALLHPERVTADGGMALFADVEVGQELSLMAGTTSSLVKRAGVVVGAARGDDGTAAAGGLVIYCAGCRLAVGDDLDDVRQQLNDAFDGAPYVVAFTFGEQGCLLGSENHHGNLMISAAVFGTA